MTDEDWAATLAVNLLAAVRTTRAALPHLLERGTAAIVTVSSVNAFLPDPLVIDYSAAKAALTNFCKSLSKQVGPQGVRVNTVSPGPVDHRPVAGRATGVAATVAARDRRHRPATWPQQAAGDAVTGRFTHPEEVADLVAVPGQRSGRATSPGPTSSSTAAWSAPCDQHPASRFCHHLESLVKYLHAVFRPGAVLALAAASAVGLVATTITTGAAHAATASSAWSTSSASVGEQMPAGFTEHETKVGSIGIDYVIGGHGPTLVLLHGYPQTWYEWRDVMPALAEHYTVIAPDLPGAGRSDAPATGYDKKDLAADIHGLLAQIGHDHDIRLVGHDIGTMVAYSYAAAYPREVTKLVLSEAPIPDPSIYAYPSLTADGPGAWHFGFFAAHQRPSREAHGGREELWTSRFVDDLEVVKGAVTPNDIDVFSSYLKDPAHLEAGFQWFRTLPQDMTNDAVYQKTKLTMPVLAIGASGSLGKAVPDQVRQYATHVTGVVVPNSGHWMYEEHPAEMAHILLGFLGRKS